MNNLNKILKLLTIYTLSSVTLIFIFILLEIAMQRIVPGWMILLS